MITGTSVHFCFIYITNCPFIRTLLAMYLRVRGRLSELFTGLGTLGSPSLWCQKNLSRLHFTALMHRVRDRCAFKQSRAAALQVTSNHCVQASASLAQEGCSLRGRLAFFWRTKPTQHTWKGNHLYLPVNLDLNVKASPPLAFIIPSFPHTHPSNGSSQYNNKLMKITK